MSVTRFCIAGFPKCGTTALADFFAQSPAFHLATMTGRGHYEAPFFTTASAQPDLPYLPDRINGHKCSAYARSLTRMGRILEGSPECLFLFCVREAGAALTSWHRMHRLLARRDKSSWHFTHRTPEARAFFADCTLEEYFQEYARPLLDYAEALARFQRNFPRARFVVVSQGRLATDARGIMERLHRSLGQEPAADYLDRLPTSHQVQVTSESESGALTGETRAALHGFNQHLVRWLATLSPEQDLTLGAAEFAPPASV